MPSLESHEPGLQSWPRGPWTRRFPFLSLGLPIWKMGSLRAVSRAPQRAQHPAPRERRLSPQDGERGSDRPYLGRVAVSSLAPWQVRGPSCPQIVTPLPPTCDLTPGAASGNPEGSVRSPHSAEQRRPEQDRACWLVSVPGSSETQALESRGHDGAPETDTERWEPRTLQVLTPGGQPRGESRGARLGGGTQDPHSAVPGGPGSPRPGLGTVTPARPPWSPAGCCFW